MHTVKEVQHKFKQTILTQILQEYHLYQMNMNLPPNVAFGKSQATHER